jgi:hypothetical protein
MRDYQLISPSLEGILGHASVVYEGVTRPLEVFRVMDGPSSKGKGRQPCSDAELRVLETYFQDLYGVFIKKLSVFALATTPDPESALKLQAMLQEMIKVKKLMLLT